MASRTLLSAVSALTPASLASLTATVADLTAADAAAARAATPRKADRKVWNREVSRLAVEAGIHARVMGYWPTVQACRNAGWTPAQVVADFAAFA